MINRFTGTEGYSNLLLALRTQTVVRDNEAAAKVLAEKISLQEHPIHSYIIQQDSSDNDVHFILAGRVVIRVNNRDIAFRGPGTLVGEMAMVNPSTPRTASVVALKPTVTATISANDFRNIANTHPILWQHLALELSIRLQQRSRFISQPNATPKVFLGSSKGTLPVVNAITRCLDKVQVTVIPWSDDVFWPSHSSIEDLEIILLGIDFAVLVFGPDDTIISREVSCEGPRDNVLLEFGMLLGAIGRERTYYLKPKGMNIKIPSDLFGLNPLEYEYDVETKKLNVTNACEEITRCVLLYGAK